jgi:GT2 family glycosyltransferase
LTWRDADHTAACVCCLLASADIGQVLVVDDQSTGELRQPLGGLGGARVRLIEEPRNLGFAAGVNAGLRAAPPDLDGAVLTVNNDTVIGPDDLATLLTNLRRSAADLVAPHIVAADGTAEPSWGKLTRTMGLDGTVDPPRPTISPGPAVLFRRDLLDRVGYLDERFFMYCENVDFGWRMRRVGTVARYIPEAVAVHLKGASHGAAGLAVEAYAAHGIVVLSRLRGRTAIGLLRGLATVAKRLLERRPAAALATLDGVWLALSRPSSKGCQTFPLNARRPRWDTDGPAGPAAAPVSSPAPGANR